MICVTLADLSVKACLTALQGLDFAEIRMDTMDLDLEDVLTLFSSHPRLIATCRPGRYASELRRRMLSTAVSAGAAYVDIEASAPVEEREALVGLANAKGCKVILSHHDFERTPPREDLARVIEAGFASGAEIVKIACQASSPKDCARLLGLLDDPRPLVVIGMGPEGRMTRPASLLAGSPFTYASPGAGREAAPGQIGRDELEAVLKFFKDV